MPRLVNVRWGIVLLLCATLAQLSVLSASAAAGNVTVTGRVINAHNDAPLAGVVLLVFNASPNGQDQTGQPIAQAITKDNGRFLLSIPRAEPWPLVRIHVMPPADLTCTDLAIVGVIGAATAYHARQVSPTFTPVPNSPNASPTNLDPPYSTFEMVGSINADGSCTGSAGLYKNKPLE